MLLMDLLLILNRYLNVQVFDYQNFKYFLLSFIKIDFLFFY
jgi:hypothetical protein